MRMWMTDVKSMCRKHLLGEHVETHMFLASIKKNKNLKGFFDNNLLQISSLQERHEQISVEMIRRGYNHNSPLYLTKDDLTRFTKEEKELKVDVKKSETDLINRCPDCAKRFLNNVSKIKCSV